MTTYPNRFFHGFCSNHNNPYSHIQYFVIDSIKDLPDHEGGAIPETIRLMEDYYLDTEILGEPYYAVYAVLKDGYEKNIIPVMTTDSLKEAIFLIESITGNKVTETDVPVYKIPNQSDFV
jgi:hypothetical protein